MSKLIARGLVGPVTFELQPLVALNRIRMTIENDTIGGHVCLTLSTEEALGLAEDLSRAALVVSSVGVLTGEGAQQ
jgi:hypothetical protein